MTLQPMVRCVVMTITSQERQATGQTPRSRVENDEASAARLSAVSTALEDALPTVAKARHQAILQAATSVLKAGGDNSVVAMVRRGNAYEQLQDSLVPLGFSPGQVGTAKNVLKLF